MIILNSKLHEIDINFAGGSIYYKYEVVKIILTADYNIMYLLETICTYCRLCTGFLALVFGCI